MTFGELTLYSSTKISLIPHPYPHIPFATVLPSFISWVKELTELYHIISCLQVKRIGSLWYRICHLVKIFLLQKVENTRFWKTVEESGFLDSLCYFYRQRHFSFLASQVLFCNTLNIFLSDIFILSVTIYIFYSHLSNMYQI